MDRFIRKKAEKQDITLLVYKSRCKVYFDVEKNHEHSDKHQFDKHKDFWKMKKFEKPVKINKMNLQNLLKNIRMLKKVYFYYEK